MVTSMYKIAGSIIVDELISSWESILAEYVYKEVKDDYSGHNIYHCLRVKRLAIIIAKGENLDLETLVASAYLHDIGRSSKQNQDKDHVKIGVIRAKEILPKIGFPVLKISAVLD